MCTQEHGCSACPSLIAGLAIGMLLGHSATAAGRGYRLRIDEVMAGANGDPRVEFIELTVVRPALWGPQKRSREDPLPGILTFHDATGLLTGVFVLADPPRHHRGWQRGPVLVATEAFEDLTDLKPDFVMPPLLHALDGMVCFRGNPFHPAHPVAKSCLSYGNYRGPPEVDACGRPNGPPAPALPTSGDAVLSLSRAQEPRDRGPFGCAAPEASDADFVLGPVSPTNSRGQSAGIAATSLVEQGGKVFARETFDGNGRTCATCHPVADAFALTPEAVAERFARDPTDPLFVAEQDPNLAELENRCLLREGNRRALILEHVSGFDQAPVFRNAPHLLNIAETAPYGLSGEFDDLQDFCFGAIRQHLPKTPVRNADPAAGPLDFRAPTSFELQAMEAFMQSIRFPADGDLDLERMIEAAIAEGAEEAPIRRGQDLFFGEVGQAQCFRCHSGPVLAEADGSLGGQPGNQEFEVGVGFRAENFDDGCVGGPGDPEAALPDDLERFSTPPLVGVAGTAPFFHDNSAADLRSAVAHYTESAFRFSEAGLRMEFIPIQLTERDIEDIVAFLEAISVDPSPTSEAR